MVTPDKDPTTTASRTIKPGLPAGLGYSPNAYDSRALGGAPARRTNGDAKTVLAATAALGLGGRLASVTALT